jgi:hypothetical protein
MGLMGVRISNSGRDGLRGSLEGIVTSLTQCWLPLDCPYVPHHHFFFDTKRGRHVVEPVEQPKLVVA